MVLYERIYNLFDSIWTTKSSAEKKKVPMGHLIFDISQDLRYHVPATSYGKCVYIIMFQFLYL